MLSQAPTSAEVRAQLQASPTPLDPGLVHALLAQWWGLHAGFHRLQFEQQQVVLTLCIGERHTLLRALDFQADEVIWDGQTEDLKQLAKLCRRGTLLRGVEATGQATALLKAVGFVLAEPPHPPLTTATYDPHWVPRRPSPLVQPWTRPGSSVAPSEPVLVIGAGLAVAADAHVAGGDADDAAILLQQFGGGEAGIDFHPQRFRLRAQPAHHIAQRDDVIAAVMHLRRRR